jgi:putative PIG3 family NAD(P)H quinone oxidoreductase
MRAATVRDGAIVVEDHADPVAWAHEVLVRVHGAGLNGADLHQMRGGYPAPPGWPQDIPGMELAGEIVAIGDGVLDREVGERVMAIVGGGAQAELCVVPESQLMAVPDGLDWPAAGGLPEVFLTAHDAVFSQAELQMGERLLVHGAAGGVGTAAVQLGAAAGAHVTATVRNPDVRDQVAALGADVVLDPSEAEDGGPYDVVLELVGAPNVGPNLKALNTGGRIVIIGVGGGFKAELNLLAVMGKRARIMGSTLRSRTLEEKALATRRVERHVLPLFAAGRIRVPVLDTFGIEQAPDAYARFEAGGKLGKIVITP